MRKLLAIIILVLMIAFAHSAYAKDPPAQVMVWPETGSPVVRFSFGKFKEGGSMGSQHNYTSDTTAENLWNKPIPRAEFSLYFVRQE